MKTYLYSISRKDLPLAHASVQSTHSAIEYARLFMDKTSVHPSYIHLTIRDKLKLETLRSTLNSAGIQTAEFHEPYFNSELTAISCLLTEDQRHFLAHLQLWKLPTQAEVAT